MTYPLAERFKLEMDPVDLNSKSNIKHVMSLLGQIAQTYFNQVTNNGISQHISAEMFSEFFREWFLDA